MTTVDGAQPGPVLVDTEPAAEEPELGQPKRRRRPLVWLGLGVVVVAVVGGAAWVWAADPSSDDRPATVVPEATATVERGTIAATESWDGTLSRGTPLTIKTSVAGTVTRLPAPGATVGRGDVLFWIDEQPVTLLSGVVPMYRDLQPGDAGVDVDQLETNLTELGYGELSTDDGYTTATADAVRAWQEAIGATPTGAVPRGAVVFAPGGGPVGTGRTTVGDVVTPGTPVLDITSTSQVVNLDVDMDDLNRFAVGKALTVVLPDGTEVPGTVSATELVEATAEPMSDDETESVVQAEIALSANASDQLVGASVEVVLAIDERPDVLLVPVTALLALAGGGYGLEVVAGDTTSIVPVETGLFAAGKVEVSSPDIAEGTVVGVAGR